MNKNKGFTLIEVMVVISIIALMSSVALSSMTSAYSNARDSKKTQLVKQYITALELYRNDNSSYPDTSGNRYCLGEVGSNVCHAQSRSGNATLNAALDGYIKGTPPSLEKVMGAGFDFHGITFIFCSADNIVPGCIKDFYQLQWYVENQSNNCAPGKKSSSGAATQCTYP